MSGQAAEAGPLSYTAHFAEYEAHTRGIGSRLLARWGYVAGRGLGARGQGMPAPLEVRVPGKRNTALICPSCMFNSTAADVCAAERSLHMSTRKPAKELVHSCCKRLTVSASG